MTIETEPASTTTQAPQPAPSANQAVAACCAAWSSAYNAVVSATSGPIENRNKASHNAAEAYRRAMPTLSGPQSIGDFIACVAHGMLVEAISGSDGTKLLYAAQVASTFYRTQTPKQQSAA